MGLRTPVAIKAWHLSLIAVLFAIVGWVFVSWGLHILSDGFITYTKGRLPFSKEVLPPRTVSPAHGPFEFYYQVAFMLSLGFFWTLCSMAIGLAAVGVFLDGANHPRIGQAAKRAGRILLYCSLPVGATWLCLHVGRYWLI